MNVTLTKVSYSEALSEETSAFSATVCIDGVPSFIASNHGTGGDNNYHALPGQLIHLMRAQVEALNVYAKTLPVIVVNGHFSYAQEADTLIDAALSDWLIERDVRKRIASMKTRVILIEDGKIFQTKKLPPERVAPVAESWVTRYPKGKVLNKLPIAEAEQLLRDCMRS